MVAYHKDGHATGSETNLLMRRTYNKGLTNPEYKSTPQDLTDEKGGEDSGMQAQGIQDKALARIQVFFQKSSLLVNPYF
jgi:secreted protein with Ig-like and vWFA domain